MRSRLGDSFLRVGLLVTGAVLVWPIPRAISDPLVIVRAMTATTIAEVYLEPDSASVELEIGLADLAAFRHLLPDELYERLDLAPEPWPVRLERFFREDLTFRFGSGPPVPGLIRHLEVRARVQRDEITGDPLPVQDPEAEPVLFARLVYPVTGEPAFLELGPPRNELGASVTNIGFVLYHRGIPVNDFRYLSQPEPVDLDWSDPWYSRFRNRNLWRQYQAPISAYLYVEPYEVRQEVVVRPIDLEAWIDLGLEGVEVIDVDHQEEIKRRVVEFLQTRNPVRIDGRLAEPRLDRVNFIYRTLRTSGVIDPPRDLEVHAATLGVIFYYSVDALPDRVSLEWELYDNRVGFVPAAATDEAGALPYILRPDDSTLIWRNHLTNPTIPGLVAVESPPAGRNLPAILGVLVGAIGLVIVGRRHGRAVLRRQRPPASAIGVALAGLAMVVALAPRAVESGRVSDDEAGQILDGLLTNTYGAFDYREEDRIYDTLERSVAGDLLTEVYLETRRSLELENQGGARVKVTDVEVLTADSRAAGDGIGFESRSTWNVAGSVGHWGHIHQRRNQYEARFVVRALDGVWKITRLELLQEERLSAMERTGGAR